MKKFLRQIIAGGLFAVLGVPASAALIDFTDPSSFAFSKAEISGTADGVGYSLTPNIGKLREGPRGPGAIGPLLGLNDGIGIKNDEVTFPSQALTLVFDQSVTITNLYFLDLFQAKDLSDREEVLVSVDGASAIGGFTAQVPIKTDPFGFGSFGGLSLAGTTFTFTSSFTNDGVGRPDFALAGVSFDVPLSPVPLPAGILLLAAGLGAFGAVRARQRAAS